MKVLGINPNSDGYGKINIGFTMVMNVLQNAGHEVELFDTTFNVVKYHQDEEIRNRAHLVTPVDLSWMYDYKTPEQIDGDLRKHILRFAPDLVACTIVEENYEYASHLLGICKEWGLPTIVGGCTPSSAPLILIENPNIDYICQGEGELAMPYFCELLELGVSNPYAVLPNIWEWVNGRAEYNPMLPFIDMAELPIQNLDMWDDKHHYKPFRGKLWRNASVEMSRGCPWGWCTYCINSTLRLSQKECGKWHREKPIANVIKELKHLIGKHDLDLVFFADDDFCVMGRPRWEEFCYQYKKEIGLPYWMNTELASLNEHILKDLVDTGCEGMGIGLESGSEWVRTNVLNRKPVSNEVMKQKFKLIEDSGLTLTLNSMIGMPLETEAHIFETIKFLKELQPKTVDVNYMTPFVGSQIHKLALQLGCFEPQTRPGFRTMIKDPCMRKNPAMNLPQISRERLTDIYFKFHDYVRGEISIPRDYE